MLDTPWLIGPLSYKEHAYNCRKCGIDFPPLLAAGVREDGQVLVTGLLAAIKLQLQEYSSNDNLY